MTLLVRDNADIIRENIEYHLSRGVEKIIATDNLSNDGTTEILKEYERLGVLHYIYEESDDYSQDVWVTRMVHIAADQYHADWVIHTDADEFWWCELGTNLKNVLNTISNSIDGLIVQRSNFFAKGSDNFNKPFYQHMIYRHKYSVNPLGDPLPPKVCHRARNDMYVNTGNHSFSSSKKTPIIENSNDLFIWHFPFRGFSEFQHKIKLGGAALERNTRFPIELAGTWRILWQMEKEGKLFDYYLKQCFSEEQLQRMLINGEIVKDTRFAIYMEKIM